MTAKEKAIQLYEVFGNTHIGTVPPTKNETIAMALVSIDETIDALIEAKSTRNIAWLEEVKSELNKL